MKKTLLSISILATVLVAGCSGSNSDEFEDANGNAVARYIRTLNASSTDGPETIVFNYDASGKVISVENGSESSALVYENNNLTNITGDGDVFAIAELYQAPYQAYDVGEVLNYDSKGNPVMLRLFEEDYNGNIEEYRAEVTYDNKPFFGYHTLKAAGVIDVLDRVELNLNMQSLPEEIVRAKTMLPVNNTTKVVVKNLQGQIVSTVLTSYAYNADNYPISATMVVTDDSGETSTETFNFTYR
ncbi:hypothetical protein GV828_06975 [Flavobacterium sp. NST-5]|uniref:YD repeat-containing protein n=1 Tax=Flavobacterium ichthyis TaxID=2698827 RepID=A0ABW9ZAZ7_9FLAO|nr:hypothetical protein [Flavobacterium ichthyis]NBL64939.1 hypothetical protein [Flavobacterium ichthyis]